MMRINAMKGLPMNILFVMAALLLAYTLYLRTQQVQGGASNTERSSSDNKLAPGTIKGSIATPVKVVKDTINFKKPDDPKTVKDVWHVVEEEISLEIYLYSAYLDERETIEHPTVRVMAIIDRDPQSLYCILWFSSDKGVYVNAERTKAGPWYFRHGRKFQGEVFSCGIPKDQPTPLYVSVVKSLDVQPSNCLPIQIPEKPETQLDLGVCICKPYGKVKAVQLIEWVEILKIWGVNEISIYNNTYDAETMKIIEDYVRLNEVVLKPVPDVMDDEGEETTLLSVAPILNDCMYRNLYRYRALLSIDLTDLVVPKAANDYYEMLTDIQRLQPSKHPATAYMFRNTYFFLDLPTVKAPDFVITQKYVYRVSPDPFGASGRSIISPRACVVLNEHMCWKIVPKYNTPGWLVDVKTDIATNHRYVKCPLDDFYNEPGLCDNRTMTIYRDESMLSFGETLVEKASQVFFRMDMEYLIFGEKFDDTEVMGNMAEGFNDPNNENKKDGGNVKDDSPSVDTVGGNKKEIMDSLLEKSLADGNAAKLILESLGKDKDKVLTMLQTLNGKAKKNKDLRDDKKIDSASAKGKVDDNLEEERNTSNKFKRN